MELNNNKLVKINDFTIGHAFIKKTADGLQCSVETDPKPLLK